MKNNAAFFGGIEGGGTKFVCAIGSDPNNIRVGIRFPTTTPKEILDHPAWELEAGYISHALASYIYTISPKRIIVGGGVGSNMHLLKMVQESTRSLINGYIPSRAILEEMDSYIVPPALGNRAGVAGALALAQRAFQDK